MKNIKQLAATYDSLFALCYDGSVIEMTMGNWYRPDMYGYEEMVKVLGHIPVPLVEDPFFKAKAKAEYEQKKLIEADRRKKDEEQRLAAMNEKRIGCSEFAKVFHEAKKNNPNTD